MLRSLHIRNYILIDSLDISFPEGLVIITGQTGAGKSILLGALSLLAGAKADASMLSPGADSCVVEAEFDSCPDILRTLLAGEDIEQDGDSILIRRMIARSGRSRSFVNDCPVSVGFLQDISSKLVDIHSQHRSLMLSDRSFQLSVLDYFAGDADDLEACRSAWTELQGVRSELSSMRHRLERLDSDREYNMAQLSRLTEARLVPGELERLEAEHRSLANAGQIKEALAGSMQLISPSGDARGMSASLKEAERMIGHISAYLPDAASLCSRMESLRIEMDDICSELESLNSEVDMSPSRLEEVEDRMSLIYSLLKKHQCSTVEELVALRDSLGAELADSSSLEEDIAELEDRERELLDLWRRKCSALSAARKAAAPSLAAEITASLKSVELERAVFEVDVQPVEGGGNGADGVTFRFSSTGASPVDVSKVASGGEVSRIMLCLKALMAKFASMPTLIFDEIDTGVSGSVADKMGQMICSMGRDMQVFSITHLPQVAAKGDAHYVVSKNLTPDGRTVSTIRRVEGEERVDEIARLLSGSTVTAAAVANARALLEESR